MMTVLLPQTMSYGLLSKCIIYWVASLKASATDINVACVICLSHSLVIHWVNRVRKQGKWIWRSRTQVKIGIENCTQPLQIVECRLL